MADPAYAEYPYAVSTDHVRLHGGRPSGDPHPSASLDFDRWHSGMLAADAVLNGDVLGSVLFRGWDTAALTIGARLDVITTADWTSSVHGTKLAWSLDGVAVYSADKNGLYVAADPTAALGVATKQYVDARAGGVVVGATPPATPLPGALWWRNDPDGNLYVYYTDASSSQWVPAMASVGSPLWQYAGALLTPTDATKTLALAAATALQWGTSTVKARLVDSNVSTTGAAQLQVNAPAGVTQDDATKSSWLLALAPGADNTTLMRLAAGGSAWVSLFKLDASGQLSLLNPGQAASPPMLTQLAPNASGALVLQCNNPWSPQIAAKSSYALVVDAATDQWYVARRAPNAAAGTTTTPMLMDASGNLAITGKYNAPALVGAANSAAQTGGSWSTYNTWLDIMSQTITTKGGLVIVTVNHNLSYIQLGASGNTLVDLQLLRDGGSVTEVPRNIGGAVVTPIPAFTYVDNPPAGAHTYKLQLWIASGTSGTVTGTSGNNAYLRMNEIGA